MNIEKAKAELQAAMTGPAGKNWGYGPAVKTLLNELDIADKRNERALSLLNSASTENVWEIIGRLKLVISGDYRSEKELNGEAPQGA